MEAFIFDCAIFITIPDSLALAHVPEIIKCIAPFTITDVSAIFFFVFVLEIRDSNLTKDEFIFRPFAFKIE